MTKEVVPAVRSSNQLIQDLNSIQGCHAGLDPASVQFITKDPGTSPA